MKTSANNLDSRKFDSYEFSKPDHIDTAHENEAIDNEFTSGQNEETNYRQYCNSEDSYELIESGLNYAEDNTPFSTYDDTNPYDSFNLDHEDDKYNCPPYRDFE